LKHGKTDALPHLPPQRLRAVFRRLETAYGRQDWWPADTRFEILIGAVLTQNTAWTNVERALANLRARRWLGAQAILQAPRPQLAAALKPSGYFNLKAQRLRALCAWFVDAGGFRALDRWETARLRHALLGVHGIGPETADDIVLYAFHRPVFVIDAYTRRLFTRLGFLQGHPGYEALRAACERVLPADATAYQQYHALIVEHAKRRCRPRPLCASCVLRRLCPAAAAGKAA
jgi:endonuclease III related protein